MRFVKFNWTNLSYVESLWEAYLEGSFNYDKGLTKENFVYTLLDDMRNYTDFKLIITNNILVCFIFTRYIDNILEPHVVFYPKISVRNRIEAYNFFFKTLKEDTKIRGCFLRSYIKDKSVFDHFCKKGILKFFRNIDKEFQYILIN